MANRWSSANSHSSITLSGGDLIATGSDAAGRTVRSLGSVVSGKVYAEFVVDSNNADVFVQEFAGICNEDYDATGSTSVGESIDAWCVRLPSADKRHNGSSESYAIGSFVDGDTFHVAVDMATKKVWWGRNNTFVGDPAAGTGEAYTFTGSGCFVAVDLGVGEEVTARFAVGDWVYTPPTGFATEWPETSEGASGPPAAALTITGHAPVAFMEPVDGQAEAVLSLSISALGVLGKVISGEAPFSLAIEGVGSTLPDLNGVSFGLEIQGIGGAVVRSTGTTTLPLLTATGEAATGTVGIGAVTLPLIHAAGYSAGSATIALPLLTLTAQGAIGSLGNAALALPLLQVTASGDVTNWSDGSLVLPKLVVSASGIVGSTGLATLLLPLLDVAGQGHATTLMTGSVLLPVLELQGNAVLGNVGTSGLVLPMLRAQGVIDAAALTAEWVTYNPEVFAHTRYTLTGVTALGELDGQVYLMISTVPGSNGVYQLAGDSDSGADIASVTRSGLTDFNSDFLKTAANLYAGYNTDGVINVVTVLDGGTSYTYALGRDLIASGQRGARATLGRGLRSRYWQIGFENVDGADFTVDSFSITLRDLKRKS